MSYLVKFTFEWSKYPEYVDRNSATASFAIKWDEEQVKSNTHNNYLLAKSLMKRKPQLLVSNKSINFQQVCNLQYNLLYRTEYLWVFYFGPLFCAYEIHLKVLTDSDIHLSSHWNRLPWNGQYTSTKKVIYVYDQLSAGHIKIQYF